MSRRGNAAQRCARCHMHASLCVCELIPSPPLATRTRLVLFMHRCEARKPTNTGRLAALCLANSEIIVRGNQAAPTPPFVCEPSSQPLLLFPFEGALPLAQFVGSARPVTLIVPDGTWRQAAKVRQRVSGLAELPCVSLPPGAPSSYRLRTEPNAAGLSTLEAIARAMGMLEGLAVREALERVFHAMVERTLWARGLLATAEVEAGIPAGAMRHDPKSGLAR